MKTRKTLLLEDMLPGETPCGVVCSCGTTRRANCAAIRVSICSWAMAPEDIDKTIAVFRVARDR